MSAHPTSPFLASSGLDDNVKIWMPSSQQWPVTLKGIKQRICSNVRDRKIEQRRAADHVEDLDDVDASMIWLIIRQLRQRQRGPRKFPARECRDYDFCLFSRKWFKFWFGWRRWGRCQRRERRRTRREFSTAVCAIVNRYELTKKIHPNSDTFRSFLSPLVKKIVFLPRLGILNSFLLCNYWRY